jgi:hypothetical protein
MTLPGSGTLLFSQIQTEFGGSNPVSLTEYYRGGGLVGSNNTGVPTSGVISVTDFYGAVAIFTITLSSNQADYNLATAASNAGWNGSSPVVLNINSSVFLYSTSTTNAGLIISNAFSSSGLTINNSGNIIGMGGAGGTPSATTALRNGSAGGSAISNASSNVALVINSGAYVAGGGGGGGAGLNGDHSAGGGSGAGSSGTPGSAGAAVSYTRGDLGTFSAAGCQAGGRSAATPSGSEDDGPNHATGQSGGRVLPGQSSALSGFSWQSGGSSAIYYFIAGGAGGAAGSNGGDGQPGGGGGWGAAGGSGQYDGGGGTTGAAGAAISGTAISTTNNGTIYGATS